jgi:hypothetical protein
LAHYQLHKAVNTIRFEEARLQVITSRKFIQDIKLDKALGFDVYYFIRHNLDVFKKKSIHKKTKKKTKKLHHFFSSLLSLFTKEPFSFVLPV